MAVTYHPGALTEHGTGFVFLPTAVRTTYTAVIITIKVIIILFVVESYEVRVHS